MKYKIRKDISKTIQHPNTGKDVIIYRIEALKDFRLINGKTVKAGELGGWVQTEYNLSQTGNCWTYEECTMLDFSRRKDNSVGYGNSMQLNHSMQSDSSIQRGNSIQKSCSIQKCNSVQQGYSVSEGNEILC